MEVAEKGLITREVIGDVGGEKGFFYVGLGRGQLGCICQDREAPELSASVFTPTCGDGRAIWGEKSNVTF